MAEDKHVSRSQLKDLTLIIPTVRGEYCKDLILALHGYQDYSVIVVSQSLDEKSPVVSLISHNISWINGPISYHQRLLLAAQHIRTPYVCMCGDDEFHFLTGLSQSIEFLHLNPQYITCSGYPLSFESSLTIRDSNDYRIGFPFGFLRHSYKFPSNLYDNPTANRVVSHFADYKPRLIYSVTRADKWISVWRLFAAIYHDFPYRGFHELFYESAISFHGLSHLLPIPMWYRSQLFENLDSINSADPYLNSSNLRVKDVFKSTSQSRPSSLSNILSSLECPNELGAWIDLSLNVYSDSVGKSSTKSFLRRILLRLIMLLRGAFRFYWIVRLSQILLPQRLFYLLFARCSSSHLLYPSIARAVDPRAQIQLSSYIEITVKLFLDS